MFTCCPICGEVQGSEAVPAEWDSHAWCRVSGNSATSICNFCQFSSILKPWKTDSPSSIHQAFHFLQHLDILIANANNCQIIILWFVSFTCAFCQHIPAPLAVARDRVNEQIVFFASPRPSPQVALFFSGHAHPPSPSKTRHTTVGVEQRTVVKFLRTHEWWTKQKWVQEFNDSKLEIEDSE